MDILEEIESAEILGPGATEAKCRVVSEIQSLRTQLAEAEDRYQQAKSMCEDFDSHHCCPKCFSQNVEQVHPAGPDDFGAFKCHDCDHPGEVGEDFPSGTAVRAKLANAEGERDAWKQMAEAQLELEMARTDPDDHDAFKKATDKSLSATLLIEQYGGDPILQAGHKKADLEIQLAEAEKRAEEAEAVVAKLPKTADGVPIYAGMVVWFIVLEDPEWWGVGGIGDAVEVTVHSISDGKSFDEYKGTCTVTTEDHECGNLEVYSTAEAALATRQGEGGEG